VKRNRRTTRKAQLAHLEDNEREAQKGLKRKLSEQFSRARAEIQATVDAVKGEQKLIKAKAAKQRYSSLRRRREQNWPGRHADSASAVGGGDQVEISGLGMTGTLLEPPQGKKRVRVKVGEGEVLATVTNLVGLAQGRAAPSPTVSSSPRRVSSGGGLGLDEQTVVDVRGKARTRRWMTWLRRWIVRRWLACRFWRIIHGHGTGKLKASLRDYLNTRPM